MIVKKDKQSMKLNAHSTVWVWRPNRNGKLLLVRRGTDATNLPDDYVDEGSVLNRDHMYMIIAKEMAEGSSFAKLAKLDGYPAESTLYMWYSTIPRFRTIIDAAKKQRAELFRDRLQDIAETVEEENSKSSKVKIDAYKYLMEVGDRDQFGSQTKISGDPNQPISFIFNTGIVREKDSAVEVESTTIEDDSQDEAESNDAEGS